MRNMVKGVFRPGVVSAILFLHIGALGGIGMIVLGHIAPVVWWSAGGLYLANLIGISVGYHRYWTHRSFECRQWVQYALAVCGATAAEGPLTQWVKDHLQHHAYTDKDGDPHSPVRWGFFWAHMGWLLYETLPPPGWRSTSRFATNPVVQWQRRWYWLLVGAGFALPTLVGFWYGGPLVALQALLIAGFLRTVLHLHITWCVNSVAHLWGSRAVDASGVPYTNDASRNNWILALFSLGEGWHSNHHADPNSAVLGVKWWHFDPGKWLIYTLRTVGLAWNVRPFSPR
jgi:stearoyl-CoA desaturase (Delta-9 desaturase)